MSAAQRRDLPKLLDQRTAIRLLVAEGWNEARGGKHVVKMRREGHRPITLPKANGEKYGIGLTRAIYRQAGLIDESEV